MIQCMNHTEITPKWSQVKDLKKVEKILAKQAILAIDNLQPSFLPSKARPSLLAPEVELDNFNNESMQGFKNKQKELNKFSNLITKLLFELLSTNAKIVF